MLYIAMFCDNCIVTVNTSIMYVIIVILIIIKLFLLCLFTYAPLHYTQRWVKQSYRQIQIQILFLIHESLLFTNGWMLVYFYFSGNKTQVHHIQIYHDEESVSLDRGKTNSDAAASIPELLEFYMTQPLQIKNPKCTVHLSQVLNNSDPINER